MYRLVGAVGIIFCLLGPPVLAAEQEQPSLDLLEFLGDWVEGDDGWLDPIEFEGMELPEQERENDETAKK
jgi:hypothetical protein